MQNVESKPCDVCGERSTSYSSGHGRWCDKHSPLPNFNPDLKGRREELKRKILKIIESERTKPVMMVSYEQYQEELKDLDNRIVEKILQELNL